MNGNMFSYCQKNEVTLGDLENEEDYDTYEIHINNQCGPTGPPGIMGPIDDNILPETPFAYDVGSTSSPFRQVCCNDIVFVDVSGASQEITFRNNVVNLPPGTLIGGVQPGTFLLKGSLANVTLLPNSATIGDAYMIGTDLHVCTSEIPLEFTIISNIRGPEGPVGAPGLMGPTGPTGPAGSSLFEENNDHIAYNGLVKIGNLDVSGVAFGSLPLGWLGHVLISPQPVSPILVGWPNNNQSFLTCFVNFQVKGPIGPRKIKTHICLHIDYSINSTLYVAIYNQNQVVQKFKKTMYGNGSDIVHLEHYDVLDVGVEKDYTLFLASSSSSGITVNNYTPSFITIEDVGM